MDGGVWWAIGHGITKGLHVAQRLNSNSVGCPSEPGSRLGDPRAVCLKGMLCSIPAHWTRQVCKPLCCQLPWLWKSNWNSRLSCDLSLLFKYCAKYTQRLSQVKPSEMAYDHLLSTPSKRHWTQDLMWLLLNFYKLSWWPNLTYVQVTKISLCASGQGTISEINRSRSLLLICSPKVSRMHPFLSISSHLPPWELPAQTPHSSWPLSLHDAQTLLGHSPPLKPCNGFPGCPE